MDPLGRPVPRTTTELVARVEEAWPPTREAIERLASRGLGEPTAAGWSARALALHVAAWHELTIRRLGEWLQSGERPAAPDVDAFNAGVVAEAERTPDEEVLRRLDASYGAFLEAVRSLPTERLTELDGWPVVAVAGNSYGHYEEHAEELGAA